MARLGLFEWLVLGGVGAFALYEAGNHVDYPPAGDSLKPGCRKKSDPALARAVAEKWAPRFDSDVSTMMVIAKIESGYRADCLNTDPRALLRLGAFGMWQQTYKTAVGHVKQLREVMDSDVQANMVKWVQKERLALLDPDFNGMLAAKQLGELKKRFGNDLALIAAGYHAGAGKVAAVLAAGQRPPDGVGPYTKLYVSRALAAQAQGVA